MSLVALLSALLGACWSILGATAVPTPPCDVHGPTGHGYVEYGDDGRPDPGAWRHHEVKVDPDQLGDLCRADPSPALR